MKVYLNASFQLLVIPVEILEQMGKPLFLGLYYKKQGHIIALLPDESKTKDNLDIPEKMYDGKCKGLRFFGGDFGRSVCGDMNWKWTIQQMEVAPIINEDGGLILRLDNATQSNAKIVGHDYLLPICQYDEFGAEEEAPPDEDEYDDEEDEY